MKTKLFNALSLALIAAMLVTSLALASDVNVAVVDVTVPTNSVTLAPGASGNITINMSVTGNQAGTATFEVYRDWVLSGGIFTGSNPQEFTVPPRAGGDPPTTFSASGTVTVATGHAAGGPFTLAVSAFDITNSNATGAKLNDGTDSNYQVTVSTPPPPSDTTAPIITPNVSGTLGNNGWYTSDVNVSWTVNDPESTVTSTSGCGPSSVTSDTAGQTFTCSATSAGGSNSASITIKRDATAPTISGSAAPAPNTAGWNNGDVAVSFSCSDGMSGIASCGPNQTLSADGDNQSATGTAVDNAGNSAGTTVSGIKIDKSAPSVSADAAPPANSNGWNNNDVTVSFSGTDGLSGIDACDADVVLSGEGAGQSATGSCTDLAGNSASATADNINIDKTAPTISGSASPAANGAGWNDSDVTVSFTCDDSLSGIASCTPSQTLSNDGAGQSVTGTAVDNADNSASTTVSGIKIDKTAPSVSVTGVSNGATYTLGSVPIAGCSTTDALSGVATAASLSLSGGPVGSITATCSGASDNAGNTSSASATYSVIYNWSGFFQPVDNLPVLNKAKAGSAIPVKFSLSGNQGLGIFAAGYPVSTLTACGSTTTDTIETTVTAGGSSLSYDALADQYIYVWKTDKSWAGTCRTLTVKLADGTIHQANFNFTK